MIKLTFTFEDQTLQASYRDEGGWLLAITDNLMEESCNMVMPDQHFAMLLSIMVQGDETFHNPDYHAILSRYFDGLSNNLRLIP